MKSITKVSLSVIALAIIGASLTWLAPIPANWQDTSSAFHLPLFMSLIYTVLHLGGAALFFMGLGAYKARLRLAYTLVALSIALVALGLVQLPVFNAYNLLGSAWVKSGAIMLPFIICGVGVFVGVSLLAKLVGAKTLFTKYKFVLPLVFGAVMLSSLLPHVATDMSELLYDISNGPSLFVGSLFGISMAIVLRVKQHIGSHYTSAMAWLGFGFFASTVISVTSLIITLFTNVGVNFLLDSMLIASGLIYLKAGHVFAETKEL